MSQAEPARDGTAVPARSRASRMASSVKGRSGHVLENALHLSSDQERHGQEAFVASPFSRLALIHATSMAGDALVTLALAGSLFFNISLSAARGRVALSLILTIAPFAVVAPFLGPIIDRSRGGGRMMVLATAIGRGVACFLMARYLHGLLLFPAAFLTLVCSKTYTVAKAALVPSVVERPEDLVEANSKLAVGGSIVALLVAIPGVALLKLLGGAWLLRIDMVLYLACAVSAVRLRSAPHPIQAPRHDKAGAATTATWPESGSPSPVERPAGPSLPSASLHASAVAMADLRLAVGFMTFLVAFGFRHDHAPAWWYGLVLIVSQGGNLLGAAMAPRLRSRVREEWIVAGSVLAVAAAGLVALQLAGFHRRPAAGVLAAAIGVSAGAAKLAFDSLVQRNVPATVQGRAFGRFEAGFQLVWVFGALLPVVISMTLRTGFVVIVVITVAAGTFYLVATQLARRDRLPHWWPGGDPSRRRGVALAGGVGVRDGASEPEAADTEPVAHPSMPMPMPRRAPPGPVD